MATSRRPQPLSYAAAGVNLEEKDSFTESLGTLMRKTHGPRVIPNPGGFAGLFRLDFNEKLFRRNYKHPVLVACADGVGTKLRLAIELKKYDTLGIDLVAMNINDMIVQGAEPLFFLDYIAIPKVDKALLNELMKGIVDGCKQSGCALLGGETAEMAGLYAPGDFDLAGFAVGVVDLDRAMKPTRVEVGDVVLGLASSGVHSNGYSLVRKVVESAGLDLRKVYPELSEKRAAGGKKRAAIAEASLGEVLLTPTRIYARSIGKMLATYKVKKVISGMAHITGSGMSGNLCRALHPKVDALVRRSAWPVPPVFRFLQERGNIDEEEMRRVFNMGIGYCVIVRPSFAESVSEQLRKLGEKVYVIGEIVKGKGDVREVE
ncbi:MAG: phosphoribosylformylglycinamidine cyclo-ligase [Phycisphaerales bacterium]|nr:phosphoribosylformylglycinamidine cyclo-ligase [Phycisphaerales bacterium]